MHISRAGIKAVGLWEGDELIEVKYSHGDMEVFIGTRKGQAIRFHESQVRSMGRAAHGVRGIRLHEDDEVVAMALIPSKEIIAPEGLEDEDYFDDDNRDEVEDDYAGEVPDSSVYDEFGEFIPQTEGDLPTLLTITCNGYGKRSYPAYYRKTRRGGKGVITIKADERNGDVVSLKVVYPDQELLLSSVSGMIIRIPVCGISVIGRNTKGVTVMRLDEDDQVTSVAVLSPEDLQNGEAENGENGTDGQDECIVPFEVMIEGTDSEITSENYSVDKVDADEDVVEDALEEDGEIENLE